MRNIVKRLRKLEKREMEAVDLAAEFIKLAKRAVKNKIELPNFIRGAIVAYEEASK